MSIYDYIYQFIETHIFNDDGYMAELDTIEFLISPGVNGRNDVYMPMREWLCTTATIIIMCLILVFAILLVRWVYRAVVSAFLLK